MSRVAKDSQSSCSQSMLCEPCSLTQSAPVAELSDHPQRVAHRVLQAGKQPGQWGHEGGPCCPRLEDNSSRRKRQHANRGSPPRLSTCRPRTPAHRGRVSRVDWVDGPQPVIVRLHKRWVAGELPAQQRLQSSSSVGRLGRGHARLLGVECHAVQL